MIAIHPVSIASLSPIIAMALKAAKALPPDAKADVIFIPGR